MATPASKRGKLEINGEYITPTKLRDAHIKLLNKFDMIEQNPFCRMCGKHKPPGDFYKSHDKNLEVPVTSICKQCAQNIMDRRDVNGDTHGSTKDSMIEALRYLDKPFKQDVWDQACEDEKSGDTEISKEYDKSRIYMRLISTRKYNHLRFTDSDMYKDRIIFEDEVMDKGTDDEIESRMQFLKDKDDVIRLVGYDPFNKESKVDQPFLYSQLLGMLDASEDSADDAMKVQSAISITRSFLQISKIDDSISTMMKDLTNVEKFTSQIAKLQQSKLQINNGITKLAAESCISLKNSKTAKAGDNTWTGKLKKIKDLNLRSAEVNGFDIGTCRGMQQVMDLSNASIIKQLRLDESEMSDMIAEQRELLTKTQNANTALQELSRILLRENMDLKDFLEERGLLTNDNLMDLNHIYSQYGYALGAGEAPDEAIDEEEPKDAE